MFEQQILCMLWFKNEMTRGDLVMTDIDAVVRVDELTQIYHNFAELQRQHVQR
jgi:hypothetical protein